MKRAPVLNTIYISALLAGHATAQVAPNGCYARFYSAEHLTANPAHVVEWIAMDFTPDNQSPATNLSLRVRMANQGHAARNGVGGRNMAQLLGDNSSAAQFQVDGDGGALQVTRLDANALAFQTDGVFLSPGVDFFEDATSTLVEGPGGPTTCRLQAADSSVCG